MRSAPKPPDAAGDPDQTHRTTRLAGQTAQLAERRAPGLAQAEFARRSPGRASVIAHVNSEVGRGRDHVRVVIVATVTVADVAEALDLAWWVFRKAAGDDAEGWDMAGATAEVRPG